MVAARILVPQISVDEYLERERRNDERHELLDGMAYMMAGTSERHATISGNAYATLHAQVARRPCKAYTSDLKVLTPSGLAAYPDVMVVCGEPQLYDRKGDVLLNPVVIIEVLSPSTATYDRTLKFDHYKSIPSLREYILFAQDGVLVEHYVRGADDRWTMTIHTKHATVLTLASIECTLALEDVYAKVALE
jgi:Uma2 family endonuclease